MKKLVYLLCSAVLVTTVLVGCGKSDSNTIKLSTWAGGEELTELQAIVDKINAENEDFNIEIVSIPADYTLKIQTQLSAGNGPDIMWLDQGQMPQFANNGGLISITDNFNNSEVMSKYTFNEQVLKSASFGGEQYGLPWISNPLVLYYNKDLVSAEDAARLEMTNDGEFLTMDEFTDLALKYNDSAAGTNGTLINGWPPLEYFIWSYGGEVQNANGEALLDSPEAKAGINKLASLILDDKVTPDTQVIDQAGYTGTFQQGKTAFLFGGVSDGIELNGGVPVDFEVGYAVVPGEVDTTPFNWNASYVMSKDAKDTDLAYKAMEALTIATWNWKVVPPVDVVDLGYADFEDYISQNVPSKVGLGKTIEQSMNQTKVDSYSANSAVIYGAMFEEIYSPILNARVNKQTVDVDELINNAMTKISNNSKTSN